MRMLVLQKFAVPVSPATLFRFTDAAMRYTPPHSSVWSDIPASIFDDRYTLPLKYGRWGRSGGYLRGGGASMRAMYGRLLRNARFSL